jgi:hypothetical protein
MEIVHISSVGYLKPTKITISFVGHLWPMKVVVLSSVFREADEIISADENVLFSCSAR